MTPLLDHLPLRQASCWESQFTASHESDRESVERREGLSSPAFAGSNPLDSTENRNADHPSLDCTSSDIVTHVIHVHHRSLRKQSVRIGLLLDKVASTPPTSTNQWRIIAHKFSDLHYELVCCLLCERWVIFPQIDESKVAGSSLVLREAIRAIGRRYSCLLHTFWELMDFVSGAASLTKGDQTGNTLIVELSALRDDYYQHLYEVECLLFPRVVSKQSSCQGCPVAVTTSPRPIH